jgi:hypothetical protein
VELRKLPERTSAAAGRATRATWRAHAPGRHGFRARRYRQITADSRWSALARNVITQEQYSPRKISPPLVSRQSRRSVGSIDLDRIFAPDLGGFSGMAREASSSIGNTGKPCRSSASSLARSRLGGVPETPLERSAPHAGLEQPAAACTAAAERAKTALDELCRLWGIGVGGPSRCRSERGAAFRLGAAVAARAGGGPVLLQDRLELGLQRRERRAMRPH